LPQGFKRGSFFEIKWAGIMGAFNGKGLCQD